MTDSIIVSVLGTGITGAAMARNPARAGHTVRVWNRSPDKADRALDRRARPSAARLPSRTASGRRGHRGTKPAP